VQKIYLEHKQADVPSTDYGHLYLVVRDDDPVILSEGNVIRGDADIWIDLVTSESGGALAESGDEFPQTEHNYQDITGLILGSSYTENDVLDVWDGMVDFALGIHGLYDYEFPVSFDDDGRMHIANSNAVILSVLNFVNADVRAVDLVGDNPFSDGLPGAEGGLHDTQHGMPTLLGSSDGARPELIAASPQLTEGVALLGRDNVNDVLIGTRHADRFYGEQSSLAQTIDTVSYERSDKEVTVDLVNGVGSGGHADGDLYFGIENVVGSAHKDRVVGDEGHNQLFGGEMDDVLVGGAGFDLPTT
jgi:hypothetical protein